MGLVFRGILGVTASQILSNHSIVTVKMEEKQLKPCGVLMDKQNHPTFPYRSPNVLVLKWQKKSSHAFANLCLLLVYCCGASVASEQQHKQDLRRIY